MKKAAGPNGPTAKKKDPPAQNRRVDEIYLRLQKSAPFPTRKWLYVLCVSFLPNTAWSNRAYTDKQTLLWSAPMLFQKSTLIPPKSSSRKSLSPQDPH
jgi:hypothetical protein